MSNYFTELKQNFQQDFWGTLYSLQNRRLFWAAGVVVALLLELTAIFFFQHYLKMQPCEKCVYIRLSVMVLCFAALLATIAPGNIMIKVIAYLLLAWAIVQGVLWGMELNHATQTYAATGESSCAFAALKFPFGLPLDSWWPQVFMVTALCGEESWRLFGLNMAQYMLIVYAVYGALFILFMIAIGVHIKRSRGTRGR